MAFLGGFLGAFTGVIILGVIASLINNKGE